MSSREREEGILTYLREHGEASVSALSRALFVSEPTMRRDLAALSRSEKIIRTHGGAALRNDPLRNLPHSFREREHSDAKNEIGKKCLALIHDGDTVMIDGSSTALALLRRLKGKNQLVVITNSIRAPLAVEEPSVRLLVSGGEPMPNGGAFVGSHAEAFFREFHADICFFSVRTLTKNGELCDNSIAENVIRHVMQSRSKKSVLLLDSGKLGDPCIHTLCSLADIDYVVSESDISESFPAYKEKFI